MVGQTRPDVTVMVHFPATGETYPVETTCKTWPGATRQAKAKAFKILGWPVNESKIASTSIDNPR